MSKKEVPIVIITGYLGSGKTTLMQNILKQEKRKIALIVNDMGSINIDASILNKTGNQVTQVEMVEMQNGCICCTLRDEFMAEIERLSEDKSIEAIFVEASGISEPSSIAGAFLNYEEMTEDTRVYLKSVVSVVDVDRIYREFLHDLMSEDELEDGDVINLIMDQIEFCNLMILNKTDLLTAEQLEEVKHGLRDIQQEAEMIPCVNGDVDLEVILNRDDFDFEEGDEVHTWHINASNKNSKMEMVLYCKRDEMMLFNYEAPDGQKRHNRLWNGGNGWGEIKLYKKDGTLIDHVKMENAGCEYGEYDDE